jgi:hypothetical protein
MFQQSEIHEVGSTIMNYYKLNLEAIKADSVLFYAVGT